MRCSADTEEKGPVVRFTLQEAIVAGGASRRPALFEKVLVVAHAHPRLSRMRRRRLVSILAATGIALALPMPSAHAAVVKLKPSQDTYVDATAPSRAQGGAKALRLTAKPVRRGFLRFDLREAEGTLTKATLRLYLTGSKGGRLKVSRVAAGGSWSERSTTYSKAPAIGSGGVRSKRATRRGWLEVDVTGLIALGGFSDLALTGSPAAVVGSSESSRSPRLVIELPPKAPPFTPGVPFPPGFPPGPPPFTPPPFTPPANVAPTVELIGPAAADEGQTLTFNYTVTDPDSDPTVVESCGANGTREDTAAVNSFRCVFSDGPASSTVKVTADDGDTSNNIGSGQITVTVANVAPSVELTGPAAADEGQTKTYTYTVSDPGNDPDPTIGESCGSGQKTDTPAANSFDCTFPDGPATPTVTVSANDGDGTGDDTLAVAVNNVAPILTLPVTEDADDGTDRSIDLGSFEDPGAADGPWTVEVDWGDGSEHMTFDATSTGALGTRDHTYDDGGVYPVAVSVTDKDGGTDSETLNSATVTIVHDSAPNSPQDFAFTLTDAAGEPTDFVLDDDADPQHASQKTFTFSTTGLDPLGTLMSVTGTPVDGWTQADIFCDRDDEAFWDAEAHFAELVVQPGEHIECHFRSERDATLTVVHDARPDSAQDFTFTTPGRKDPGSFTLDDDPDPALADRKVFTVSGRRFGTWVISAGEVEGWGLSDLSCTGDSEAEEIEPGTVELNIGIAEEIECRFVHSRDASVTLVHDTQPDSGQDYEFAAAGVQLQDFTLDDDADPTMPAQRAFTVSATGFGPKTITQAAVAGWSLAELSCTGDPQSAQNRAQRSVALVVDPGESIVCRFVSRRTGDVGGVYPEASNFIGPFRDGNGNLYTVTELTAATPRPVIRKSTDGGRTWNEVDGANRPTHSDLESVWMVQDGTRIHVLHQRSGSLTTATRVSYHSFNTSDAATSPDTWQIKNQVVHVPALATNPDNQSVSLVQRSNGDLLAFYRTDASGPAQSDPERVAWRKKPAGGTWGAETIVDSTPGKSFTQVAAVRGANDKVHIFYKNDTDSAVWHRSLDVGNTLSAAEVVNDSPTSREDHAMSNPAYVDAVGTERVTIAWKRASDAALVGAVIDNDETPQAEEVISDSAVYENPDRVESFQPVAALAADQATQKFHAVYSADATHDLWMDARNGGWGVDVPMVEATDAEIVSSNIFSHSAGNGGHKVIGTVFDVNTGLIDNEVFYTELPLGG
jgi:hypothetical protein